MKDEVIAEEKRSILSEYRVDDFDGVLLIATAPRGGSSLLFDILRHHEGTCSLDAVDTLSEVACGDWFDDDGNFRRTIDVIGLPDSSK